MPLPVGGSGLQVLMDFSGSTFGDPTPTWTDVTADVMTSPQEDGSNPIQITWGRQDWFSTVTPSTCSLTLRNITGCYTPGRQYLNDGVTLNPNYPNVTYGVRMRVIENVSSVSCYIFDGYITDITAVPVNGSYWTVAVNATDIFGRMGTTTVLRGWVAEEMLFDHPSCLYSLQEGEGSTSFGDISANVNAVGTIVASKYGAGVVDAGVTPTATGLLNSTLVSITNSAYPTAALNTAGSWLSFPVPPITTGFTIEIRAQMPTVGPTGSETACIFQTSLTGATGCELSLASGSLTWACAQTGIITAVSVANQWLDGNIHQFVCQLGNDLKTLTLTVDGVEVGTNAGAALGVVLNPAAPLTVGMNVVASGPSEPFSGAFAFLAIYPTVLNATRLANHYHAGSTAFAGTDNLSTTIGRILNYRPGTGRALDISLGYSGGEDITGLTEQQALLDAAAGEGGLVYVDGQGILNFLNRSHNFNPSPVYTLDASQGQVDVPSTFRDDIQLVVDDVTITIPNGATQRFASAIQMQQQGDISQSITANVDTPQHALDLAGFMVACGTQDQLGIPTLTVDCFALSAAGQTSQVLNVLQTSPLDAVEVTNLPGVPPASSMTVQVQGGSYTRTSESLSVSLYATPLPIEVGVWDSTLWDSNPEPVWAY